MTALLATLIAFAGMLGIYIATIVARTGNGVTALAGEGDGLPGWAAMFAGAGLAVTGIGFAGHLSLVGLYGLQASHVGLGLVVAALSGLLVNKRLWLAGRIAGLASPGALLGTYYQSVTIRLVMMAMTLMFGLPYAAHLLAGLGAEVSAITGGALSPAATIWTIAFLMFLATIIGGWRSIVLIMAVQSALFIVLAFAVTGFAEAVLAQPGFAQGGIPVAEGILADRVAGVIQYAAGLGKEVPTGGLFTTMAILSSALAFVGVTLSPAALLLAMSARAGRSQALGPVWLVGGLGGLLLLVVLPFLAARTGADPAGFVLTLAQSELLMGAGLAFLLLVAGQIAILAFTGGGSILIARELVLPYLLPGLDAGGQRLAVRITIAAGFILMAVLAAFAPIVSAILASITLPLSVQLFPALLGIAFVPWISRSAVLTGLIIATLVVVFTEPPGLILFEGLFLDLPWGRWPLTIHSALWGLGVNVAAVLLVSIFTRLGSERSGRDRLHDEFSGRWATDFGSSSARSATWSLTLIWAFFAIGPGAILGNSFFSQPIFTEGDAVLGIASLWVWQILFWLIGVPLIWWLAYRARLGLTSADGIRVIRLSDDIADGKPRAPDWIAASIARVTER